MNENNKENSYRIRKLTPKECWRLMGFTDVDFENARIALNNEHYKGKDRSSSQLYKQAGNSIVVDVLYYIFKELYIAMPYLFDDLRVSSYFSGIGAFESALDRLYEYDIDKNSREPSSDLRQQSDKEVIGVASRGRYNSNGEVEQHFETNNENTAYCVTTVQKDSMIGELTNCRSVDCKSPELVGGFGDVNFGKQYRQGNRVYDSDSVAMCVLSQPVGNTGGYSYLYLIKNDEG